MLIDVFVVVCVGSFAAGGCKERQAGPSQNRDSAAGVPVIAVETMDFSPFTLAVPAGRIDKKLDRPDAGRYEIAMSPPDGRSGWIRIEWEPGTGQEGTLGKAGTPERPVEKTLGKAGTPERPVEKTLGKAGTPERPVEKTLGKTLDQLRMARAEVAAIAGPIVHDESVTIDGVPGLVSILEMRTESGQRGFMGLGLLQCPDRNVQITVASWIEGSQQDNLALHRSIATSLVCKPVHREAQSDGGLPELPRVTLPAFDPPAGFGYLPGSSPPTFLGIDETFYAFERAPLDPEHPAGRRPFEDIRADLHEWARGEGLVVVDIDLWDTVHEGLGKIPMRVIMARLTETEPPRATSTLFLGLFDCAGQDGGISFSVRYLAGPDIERETGAVRLARAGCPSSHPVDPANFATVSDVFQQACDRKNGRACKLLADLLASGDVTIPGTEPDVLYTRACKLGSTEACP